MSHLKKQIKINRKIEDLKIAYKKEAESLLDSFTKELISLGNKYKKKAEKILR